MLCRLTAVGHYGKLSIGFGGRLTRCDVNCIQRGGLGAPQHTTPICGSLACFIFRFLKRPPIRRLIF